MVEGLHKLYTVLLRIYILILRGVMIFQRYFISWGRFKNLPKDNTV